MHSEKEQFVTKEYVPIGEPISQNSHTIIYKVKCLAEPGAPIGILKMYRGKNIKNLYTKLMQLDFSEWPHIYNVKYFDENTLIVEEFLTGQTLAELLAKNKLKDITFTEEEAGKIMEQLCEALTELMQVQPPIIHHNLKPSNIFITDSGAVKLLDFTPSYAKAKQDPFQKMITFLGVLFHEMLTGKKPVNNKCIYEGRFQTVIHRCMEKSPNKQYASLQELQDGLDDAKTQEPESAPIRTASIPYTLTVPFQGFILAFEWILVTFFYHNSYTETMCLFLVSFCIHSVCFFYRRHAYLRKNSISLSIARKAFPILILAGILACLSWSISFFF